MASEGLHWDALMVNTAQFLLQSWRKQDFLPAQWTQFQGMVANLGRLLYKARSGINGLQSGSEQMSKTETHLKIKWSVIPVNTPQCYSLKVDDQEKDYHKSYNLLWHVSPPHCG